MVPESDDLETIAGRPFSEADYLAMNPDVRAAVQQGAFASGRVHYLNHGRKEGRIGVRPGRLAESDFFGEVAVDTATLPELRAEHFPYAGPYPWLDRDDAGARIEEKVARGALSPTEGELCRKWVRDGYLILERAIATAMLDRAWGAYERALREGRVRESNAPADPHDPYPGRLLDPHREVSELCEILRHPALLHWVRLLMDREPAPFQTITAHKGSEQGIHSDSIHMTTYPLGYLTAAWVAFEDIHPDSGPLEYYPGSHRLPYVFSKDVGIDTDTYQHVGFQVYRDRYEPHIRQLIADHKLAPAYFHARKGDVLLWHANLLHGGSLRRDRQRSRRSMVCHYFVKGAVTYHDLAATVAHGSTGTCIVENDSRRPRRSLAFWRR